MRDVLTAIAIGLLAADLFFVCLLVVRRRLLRRAEERRAAAETRLRPVALAITEEGAGAAPADLSHDDARILAGLLARYARQLAGSSRESIAAYFETRGDVGREVAALGARRTWRRATAAYSLGHMGACSAVPALVGALDDPHRDVRAAAVRSLGQLRAEAAVGPLVRSLAHGRVPHAAAGSALLEIGAVAAGPLRTLAGEADVETAAVAVELVGFVGEAADADWLGGCLSHPAPAVRARAAGALGRLGDGDAADALVGALRDPVREVRAAAAAALAPLGDRTVSAALLARTRDDDHETAQAAATSLARLDPRALREAAATLPYAGHLQEAADLLELRAG